MVIERSSRASATGLFSPGVESGDISAARFCAILMLTGMDKGLYKVDVGYDRRKDVLGQLGFSTLFFRRSTGDFGVYC